jgi:hypothetical protein
MPDEERQTLILVEERQTLNSTRPPACFSSLSGPLFHSLQAWSVGRGAFVFIAITARFARFCTWLLAEFRMCVCCCFIASSMSLGLALF